MPAEMQQLMAGDGEHAIEFNQDPAYNKKLTGEMQNPYINDEDDLAAGTTPNQETANGPRFSDDMGVMQCFWEVTKLATPMIFGMLVYLMVQLVNTAFVGNLDDPALLAGVGMGNMLVNVLCFAVVQGLNGALETLVS